MNKSHPDLPDFEALVRAAGDYVRPSDDLRTRVLETARIEVAEQRTAGRMGQLLAIVLIILLLGSGLDYSSHEPADVTPAVPPAARLQHQDNPSWDTVEAFDALRKRQVVLWQSAL